MRAAITLCLLCLAALVTLRASPAGVLSSHTHRHKAGVKHASPADIAWQTDIPAAFRLAKKQHKPLFINVSTDWCGYCAVMDRRVFPDAHIRVLTRKFIPFFPSLLSPETYNLSRQGAAC
ncbi:MAG TPA: thioredoxin family protein [Chthonomonadaceae bacterium]|nr:thioredoxin family protein [Chthonomonadaceae bacterium]